MLMDRLVLAIFYFATGGPNWFNSWKFLSEESVCQWSEEFIGCNDVGSVNRILLVDNNLNGTLPLELVGLSNLEYMNLIISNLHGTLPASLGDLPNLNFLQIVVTSIGGSIPESFSKLRKIKKMWLALNELTGTIPSDILQFSSPECLSFGYNLLTGTIPEFHFDKLRSLYSEDNFLTGPIPESVYQPPNMEEIVLWGNQLTGPISSTIGELSGMELIHVYDNQLTGTLSTNLGALSNLRRLLLYSNSFTGKIPTEFGLLTRLEWMELQQNNLSGSIPMELSSVSATDIKLEFNNLTGNVSLFCDQPELIATSISMDCGGVDPPVDCPCCTQCCDSSSKECTTQFDNACRVKRVVYDHPTGPHYIEGAGTTCECVSGGGDGTAGGGGGDDITVLCSDTECQSCNRDYTICSITQEYTTEFDSDGVWRYYKATFQYVLGRNDTIVFENQQMDRFLPECKVTVNGELCDLCRYRVWNDGTEGVEVTCNGFQYPNDNDNENDSYGPLAVFSFQDPLNREGCLPRVFVG